MLPRRPTQGPHGHRDGAHQVPQRAHEAHESHDAKDAEQPGDPHDADHLGGCGAAFDGRNEQNRRIDHNNNQYGKVRSEASGDMSLSHLVHMNVVHGYALVHLRWTCKPSGSHVADGIDIGIGQA